MHLTLELVTGSDAVLLEGRDGDVVEVGRTAHPGGVEDPHMSARHFAVVCAETGCRVRDLKSTNGTFVNGVLISETVLRDGDRITAGTSTFVVRLRSDRSGRVDGSGPIPLLQIANRTTCAVETLRWTDGDERARLTIVVKRTHRIAPDTESGPEPEQLPVFSADVMSDGDPPSVRFEADLVPFKPRTDVVLVGRAYAPRGRPVTELAAGLRVGPLRYGVAVFGDRVWDTRILATPTISPPEPFTTMDLVYERAFGGFDGPGGRYCQENLVGTGFIGKETSERVKGLRLPNLEDPRDLIRSWDSRPRPVGFGFYGRGWAPRLAYAGAYDEKYLKERHPRPPADFSYRFFNGAHPDLQVEGYLRGDEEVDLLNVCPGAEHVRFRLPGFVPKITVARWTVPPERWLEEHTGADGSLSGDLPLAEEQLRPVLDTLVFVPDDGVFYEVFRAVCELSGLDSLEIARITVTP